MQAADFEVLFAYDNWATNRVLDAAIPVGDGFLTQRGGSVGTVRDLMKHVADAQRAWLNRLQGLPVRPATLEGPHSVDEIRGYCAVMNGELRQWIRQAGDAGVAQEVAYTNHFGDPEVMPAWKILLQLYSHGIHHRAEASELLTQLGSAPQQTDIIAFFRSQTR